MLSLRFKVPNLSLKGLLVVPEERRSGPRFWVAKGDRKSEDCLRRRSEFNGVLKSWTEQQIRTDATGYSMKQEPSFRLRRGPSIQWDRPRPPVQPPPSAQRPVQG